MTDATLLRVVIFRESRFWLAQGLEHDIGVQAEHLRDLMQRLDVAIAQEGEAIAHLPAAPPYFQDLWKHRAGHFTPDEPFQHAGIAFGIVA